MLVSFCDVDLQPVQKIVASILLLAFMAQTFSQGLYYLDYMIDRTAYEKKCVNKARPQMHCNGKCELMKKIEEQEKRERGPAPEMKLSAKAEVISSKSFFITSLRYISTASINSFPLINTGVPVDQPSSIFHPPDYSNSLS